MSQAQRNASNAPYARPPRPWALAAVYRGLVDAGAEPREAAAALAVAAGRWEAVAPEPLKSLRSLASRAAAALALLRRRRGASTAAPGTPIPRMADDASPAVAQARSLAEELAASILSAGDDSPYGIILGLAVGYASAWYDALRVAVHEARLPGHVQPVAEPVIAALIAGLRAAGPRRLLYVYDSEASPGPRILSMTLLGLLAQPGAVTVAEASPGGGLAVRNAPYDTDSAALRPGRYGAAVLVLGGRGARAVASRTASMAEKTVLYYDPARHWRGIKPVPGVAVVTPRGGVTRIWAGLLATALERF